MVARYRLRLLVCLLISFSCLITWATIHAQTTPKQDDKALATVFEKQYVAYVVAERRFDLPALRKLVTPDMTMDNVGRVQHPLDLIAQLLADPTKKEIVARSKERNKALVPPACKALSVQVHGDEATTELQIHQVLAPNPQGHTASSFQRSVDWKKVGGEWKIYRIGKATNVVTSGTTTPPKWAAQFNKALGLIGKSKADLVAAFGEPASVDGDGYAYVIEQSVRKRNGTMATLHHVIHFRTAGTGVVDVLITFDSGDEFGNPHLPTAQEIWANIEMTSSKPDTMQFYAKDLKEFILNQQTGIPNQPFPLKYHGKAKQDVELVVDCNTKVPPLQATIKFNVNTDKREVGELTTNPAFHWGTLPVYSIKTDKGGFSHNTLYNGEEYPLSNKP